MKKNKKISIVCPFYNEEKILNKAIINLVKNIRKLKHDHEIILVNDGSTDKSLKIAKETSSGFKNIKIFTYPENQGRGFALKHGIDNSAGDIIITTEIDLSWGDDIVHNFINAFEKEPTADIIIASPHLSGGRYINVPFKRVFLSKVGNFLLRTGQGYDITMYTGMTRAYKAQKIKSLFLDEKGKEFHLEVISKAKFFNYKIIEIPSQLEWKDHKLITNKNPSNKRKSSTNLSKVIKSHSIYAFVSAPFRYILPISLFFLSISLFFMIYAIYNFINSIPSVFLLLISMVAMCMFLITFSISMISFQNSNLMTELWKIRKILKK